MISKWISRLSSPRRENVGLFIYSLKTPMLLLANPKVVSSTSSRVEIKLPLNWFTRNSWNTMFFAAIAAGADLTGGFAAFEQAPGLGVGVLYKNFSCTFLRRVDGPLNLVCDDGIAITKGIHEAAATGQRINVDVKVNGFVQSYSSTHPVFTAAMTLSLKQLHVPAEKGRTI